MSGMWPSACWSPHAEGGAGIPFQHIPCRSISDRESLVSIFPVFLLTSLLLSAFGRASLAAPLPPPGSPERLVDWRWLARAPQGKRVTLTGKEKLEAREGKFVLAAVEGPGVLDHLILRDPQAVLSIEVDGRPLWQGKVETLVTPPAGSTPLFPQPVFSAAPSFVHLLAPVGFHTSLRVLTDKEDLWRYVSYRTFANPAEVSVANPEPGGAYARGLQAVAAAWKVPMDTFNAKADVPARARSADVTVGAGSRATALNLRESGEITHLEFHVVPALTGSLRELVIELYYDGAKEPSVRMPLTDFVGLPHPWPNGRWDMFNGTLAAGVHYPHQESGRNYRDVTYYSNLPMPFAGGLRVDLVNRSRKTAFAGTVRAAIAPLKEDRGVGRLCGTRLTAPIVEGNQEPLLVLPGPGQVLGLGLFCTGNDLFPPAQLKGASWVALDENSPLSGPGIVPLWMAGGYGGPASAMPVWNHPRLEPQYVGVMRHFPTDPLSFGRKAAFGYDPGPDLAGAPTSATVIALWYQYGDTRYAAPPLPDHAEALPYTTFVKPDWVVPEKGAELTATVEAEDLAAMATAYGGEALAVEDPEHNYHVSGGKYLAIRADKIGDYTDCVVPMPASRYFVLGQTCLGGPVNGRWDVNFELTFLSREAASTPPAGPPPGANFAWSVLGGAPRNLSVFIIGFGNRRDSVDFYPPQLNPAPDDDGVFRFICRGPGATMIRFDQFWLYMPPPTPEDWHEFEELALPTCGGDVTASLPLTGRLEWSGWGAVQLAATTAGKATVSDICTAIATAPKELQLTGSLGPGGGAWKIAVIGSAAPPVALTPGKDGNEVVKWTVPVAGLNLPGPVTMGVTYTPPQGVDKLPQSQLYLDGWTVK